MKNFVLALAICSLLVFFTADSTADSALDQLKRRGGTPGSVPAVPPPTRVDGNDTPSSTPRGVTPQPRRRTINWPALEAKYFAEADQKGWTQLWISSGTGKKRYYRKENGNWVRKSSEAEVKQPYTIPFELGKRKLLKMLKGVGPSQPPVIKGAKEGQRPGFKPAATLRARGHPIVVREALGSIEYSDLKSILAEMSDEDLQLLARFATKREDEFVSRIKRVEEKKFQATLRARTIPDFKTWKEVLWEKIKDDAPLWRLMEQLGKKAAGDLSQLKTDDIYKAMQDTKRFHIKAHGQVEIALAMAYTKFMKEQNRTDAILNALPYVKDAIQEILPTPDQLAKYGEKTVDFAKKGTVVLKIGTEVLNIGCRGTEMSIFNKTLRDEQKAGQVLALELAVRRNDLERKLNETRKLQKRVEEELKHR